MDHRLSRLAQGTLVYGLGGVLNRAVTLLLLPVFTAWLPPAAYGTAALLDVLAASLAAIFSLGFGTSMVVEYFRRPDPGHRDRVVTTALLLLLAGSGVLLLGTLPLADGIASRLLQIGHEGPLVRLSVLATVGSLLTLPFSLRLQFEERARLQVGLTVAASVLTAAFSLGGVVILGRGVRGLLEGRLAGQLVGLLLFAASFSARRLAGWSRESARELMRLGLPMVPSFASLFVLQQGNRYFLGLFQDVPTVGVYTVGTQLGAALGMAVTAFGTAWTPFFMGLAERPEEAARTISRVTTFYVLVFGTATFLFYAGARPALLLLTGEAYHAAYRFVGHAAAAQFFFGVFNLLLPPCCYAREVHYTSAVQGAAAVGAVGLNLALIPRFGADGAGAALLLGPMAMALLLGLWNRWRGERYVQVPYAWKRMSAFGAVAIPLAVLFLAERSWGVGLDAAAGGAAALVVAGVAWIVLAPEDRRAAAAAARGLLGERRPAADPPTREGGNGDSGR